MFIKIKYVTAFLPALILSTLLMSSCGESTQEEIEHPDKNYDMYTSEEQLMWFYFGRSDTEITEEQRRYMRVRIIFGHRAELAFENCPPSDSAVNAIIMATEAFKDDYVIESLPFINYFLSECDCYSEAFAMKARALMRLGEYYSSIENYNKAIYLSPKNGEYFLWRGIIYEEMGKEVLAQSDFNQAATLGDSLAVELYGGIPSKL